MTALRDCVHLEQTHAFADGELTGESADAVRDHLATCEACQAELAEVLQLDAVVADRKVAGVISLAWYRRRHLQIAGIALAAAAGVAIYVALPQPGTPAEPQQVAVALAPRRVVEARLAWRGASDYRAYDVPRAGEPPHESIAMRTLADLEARGDLHGVGALALLNGERRRAADYLERAGDTADAISDRAALALADNQPERALAFSDAALAKAAGHGPALWNRALALRDLGLSRTAAATFRKIAGRGEPGWAVEAQQRAASLDADTDALQQRFERINRASVPLARGQIELSLADAGAMPGFARAILYDAIRSASTPAELAALQPLAEAIDTADRDTAMQDALTRARGALRPALSRRYREMIRSLAVEQQIAPKAGDEAPVPTGATRRQLLAELRAAGAADLLIGVLWKLSDDRRVVNRDDTAELARLTAASPDRWMQILGLQQEADVAMASGDRVRGEAILLLATQRCTAPDAPALRCVLIGLRLGELYLESKRLPEARAALSAAWKLARATGEWVVRDPLIVSLAALASKTDTGLPLVRAYTDEEALRHPGNLPEVCPSPMSSRPPPSSCRAF
jgi:cellulose synthase operon protein C